MTQTITSTFLRSAILRIATLATVALMAAGTTVSGQMPGHEMDNSQMGRMNRGQMEKMLSDWPAASREAAMFMMKKYGSPAARTSDMIIWGKTGPWKRTIVYKMEHPHNFPGPHTDVMQQWIDMKVPVEMFTTLAQYDGSVVVERTAGEISARCDKEGANFLALNLANEIISGRRTVADARRMYGQQIMAMKAHQPAPYTEKFLFTPAMGGTGDTDHPEM